MKSMSMVAHLKDTPETLEEARHLIESMARVQREEQKEREINVYRKDVYGETKVYIDRSTLTPDMLKKAEAIQTLTGRKTLTVRDTDALKALGFTFREVLAP